MAPRRCRVNFFGAPTKNHVFCKKVPKVAVSGPGTPPNRSGSKLRLQSWQWPRKTRPGNRLHGQRRKEARLSKSPVSPNVRFLQLSFWPPAYVACMSHARTSPARSRSVRRVLEGGSGHQKDHGERFGSVPRRPKSLLSHARKRKKNDFLCAVCPPSIAGPIFCQFWWIFDLLAKSVNP